MTFLELRDTTGKTILHYLGDLADTQLKSQKDDEEGNLYDLIFTTLMDELNKHVKHVDLDMNVTDNMGRTPTSGCCSRANQKSGALCK